MNDNLLIMPALIKLAFVLNCELSLFVYKSVPESFTNWALNVELVKPPILISNTFFIFSTFVDI